MVKDKKITGNLKCKCISVNMDLHSLINEQDIIQKHVALAQYIHHTTQSQSLF